MQLQRRTIRTIGRSTFAIVAGAGLFGTAGLSPTQGAVIQQTDDGYVAFEAEDRDSIVDDGIFSDRKWTEVDDSGAGASEDRAMLFDSEDLSDDSETDRDEMNFKINFTNTGSYDLYIRHRQSTTGSDNDTYRITDDFDDPDHYDKGDYVTSTSYAYRQFESDPNNSFAPNDYVVDQTGVQDFILRAKDNGVYLDRLVFSREGDVNQDPNGEIGLTPFNDGDGDDTVFALPNSGSPVPEPASLALLGLGGGMMLLPRRRKSQ